MISPPLRLSWAALLLGAAIGAQDAATLPPPNARPASLPADAPAGMAAIDRDDLKRHAFKLAADDMGGRYTGSEGQVEAARYIAEHFERCGLLPLGEKTSKGWSFFMRYPVVRTELDMKRTKITVDNREFVTGFAVIPGKKGTQVDLRGRFAWCGEGVLDTLPKGLANAIPVVVLPGEGTQGRALRESWKSVGMVRALADRGAKAVVFCMLDDKSATAEGFNYSAMLVGKPMLRYRNEGRAASPGNVPAVFVNRQISEVLLAAFGVELTGHEIREPKTLKKPSGRLQLDAKEDLKSHALNVVGYVAGSDPAAKDEAIVFSAHMDHMGTRLDGDPFNGADDNASGTSALLELAEAIGKGPRPARSVIFLSVSGEEEGLWGSHWFSENPTWDIGKVIADINIDMIGRVADLSGPTGISMTPSHRHPQFNTLVREAAKLASLVGIDQLTSGDTFFERSDHYNFARKGVPVLFFCDGEHEDYHKVTDHADKLDFQKMEMVARLAYWVGFNVANGKERPKTLGSQKEW